MAFFVGLHAQGRARLPPVMFEFKTTPPSPLFIPRTHAAAKGDEDAEGRKELGKAKWKT